MLANRESCTGCMACFNVCHTGSISFVSVEGSLHTYEISRSRVFASDYRKLSFDKMKSTYPTISLWDILIASIKHKLKLQ